MGGKECERGKRGREEREERERESERGGLTLCCEATACGGQLVESRGLRLVCFKGVGLEGDPSWIAEGVGRTGPKAGLGLLLDVGIREAVQVHQLS